MQFRNHNSEVKHSIRQMLANSHTNPNRVLSLPCTNFEFEKMIHRGFPQCEIICAERDFATYKQAVQNIPHRSIKLYNEDIFQLSKNVGRIDIAWFDLCGVLTQDIISQFKAFIGSNSFTQGSIASITFQAARCPSNAQIRAQFGCTRFQLYSELFPEIICSTKSNVVVSNMISYRDTIPMYTITFKHN